MDTEKELNFTQNKLKSNAFKRIFSSIFNIFRKNDLFSPIFKNKDDPVSKEINNLLILEDLDNINLLLSKGYSFNKEQDEKYHSILENKMSSKFFIEIIETKKYMSESFLIKYLLNSNKINNYHYSSLFDNRVINFIKNKFEHKDFTLLFLKNSLEMYREQFQYDLKAMKEATKGDPFYATEHFGTFQENHTNLISAIFVSYLPEISKYLNRNDLINFIIEIKSNTDDYKKIMGEALSNMDNMKTSYSITAKSNKDKIINTSRNYYPKGTEPLIDKVIEHIKNSIETIYKKESQEHMNNIVNQIAPIKDNTLKKITQNLESMPDILPNECQNLLNNIEANITYCLNHKNNLQIEEIFLIEKLLNEDIPNDLSKYLTLHSDYRDTLVNAEGKKAKDILFDSLSMVSNILDQYIEKINQENITSMSVNNRKYNMYSR